MAVTNVFDHEGFFVETEELFYRRVIMLHGLGIVFFLFFSLFDYFSSPDFFWIFLVYRIAFVALLLCFLYLLHRDKMGGHTVTFLFLVVSLLLGTLTLSVMTVELGGFSSNYYLAILLIIAGAFPLLPLTAMQAVILGMAMYAVYFMTVFFFQNGAFETRAAYNNSVFFFSIVGVAAAQCYAELQVRRRVFQKKKAVAQLKQELSYYTGDLEEIVDQRIKKIEKAELQFSQLYENIFDLVLLVNFQGKVLLVNRRCQGILGVSGNQCIGSSLYDYIVEADRQKVEQEIFSSLLREKEIYPCQFRMQAHDGRIVVVEAGAKIVELDGGSQVCQLIIRNISDRVKMEQKLRRSHQLEDNSRRAAIIGLAKLAEYRDDETGEHLDHIREYTRILALQLEKNPAFSSICTSKFVEDIFFSSVLHDIGKIGIPDAILQKPGRLTKEEFFSIQRHCEIGGRALAEAAKDPGDFSFLAMGQEIVWNHHEKWDGSGYPRGIAGEKIPLSARIVALADVYDALTSPRCYKEALSHEKARNIIVGSSGHHFDPAVVEAFIHCEQQFQQVKRTLQVSDNQLPMVVRC